jgi:hypothetical protein
VDAHRLVTVLGDELLARLVPVRSYGAATEQVVAGLRSPLDDVASEVVPEARIDDREVCTLPPLVKTVRRF